LLLAVILLTAEGLGVRVTPSLATFRGGNGALVQIHLRLLKHAEFIRKLDSAIRSTAASWDQFFLPGAATKCDSYSGDLTRFVTSSQLC